MKTVKKITTSVIEFIITVQQQRAQRIVRQYQNRLI